MPRRNTPREHRKPYRLNTPAKPLPKGRVAARCVICRAEGKADGKGSPIVVKHARNCPEHPENRRG